jgi:hypothetical protein
MSAPVMNGAGRAGRLSVVAWKPRQRSTLLGFVDVLLPNGLTIRDITVHTKNGKAWVSLPAKPIVGPDGLAQRDDAGKIRYTPILEWPDRAVADRFSIAVTAAIEALHPGTIRT